MAKKKDRTIYCSLDIETSDFDATNGEIIELGMVFFELEKSELKVLSEWQSCFKPSKEVSPRILALTGISMEELEVAPLFKDKHEEIQKLVEDAVIVGHNINFDIKFMESFGIKFSGDQIDTLDLAQMILPTNQSYNLEALMNVLEVSHKDAHRALADARAAMIVVEKLLGFYAGFPSKLKEELLNLFPEKKFPYINALLNTNFKEQVINVKQKNIDVFISKEINEVLKENQKVVSFPLGFDYQNYVYGAVQKSREKILLIVNNKQIVYQLWKQKLAHPIFNNKEVFDKEAFRQALQGDLTHEQRFFYAKILVWQYTNWQSDVLCDLNFSFNGSQFKNTINCYAKKENGWELNKDAKVVVADYADFINFDLENVYSNRKLIILDLNNFEKALTDISSDKVSWNDFSYGLRQVYDPITKHGKNRFEDVVVDALAQVDLFFGLASMHFNKIEGITNQFLITEKVEQTNQYETIQKAAENFINKMQKVNEKLDSEKIRESLKTLAQFFVVDRTQIKWIELGEGRLMLSISPLSLEELASNKLKPYKKILFTASLGSPALINYFTHRLSLGDYGVSVIGQQELGKKFEVIIPKSVYDSHKILELTKGVEAPAALLLPNSAGLRAFYEENFKVLGEKFKVAAQSYSGGTNKLLNNFGINDNALLIATDYFILKQQQRTLNVKTLILTRIPFEMFTHPLFAAQAERYPNQFIDFNIPRALYNFHSLIKFFYSQNLEKIYILDQKIHKEYGKYFIDYLKSLPFVEIRYEN